jgi:ferredoxin
MAYKILPNACTGCGSCEEVCPTRSIKMKGDIFAINPETCTECVGKFSSPQCVAACPADAIIHA